MGQSSQPLTQSSFTPYHAMAFGAFFIWGLFPLFFKQLAHIDAVETLAHRMLWSTVLIIAYLSFKFRKHLPQIIQLFKEKGGLLLITALLISFNWGIYVYSVNTNRVLDASLGYFINPLFNIAIGLLFFGERLSRAQWIALGLAILGAGNEMVRLGGLPWISMGMALSFALYAGIRKKMNVDATYAFLIETLIMTPIAVVYLIYLYSQPNGLAHIQPLDPIFFVLCGLMTVVPLTWFNQSARFVPLSTLGLIQYIAPSMLFLFGWMLYKEPLDLERLLSFCFIWLGLIIVVFSHSIKRIYKAPVDAT